MKLSRTMRQNLDRVPDEGEHEGFYRSTYEPLVKRGLVTVERRRVPVYLDHYFTRLTDLGRRVKYQNEPDDGVKT